MINTFKIENTDYLVHHIDSSEDHFHKAVEERMNATYLGEFPYKVGEEWLNEPVMYFWTDEKHPQGSHYFTLRMHDKNAYISNGGNLEDIVIEGAYTKNGTVVYSAYRHDYQDFGDGLMADGGQEYFRCSVPDDGGIIRFKFKDGKAYEVTKDGSED